MVVFIEECSRTAAMTEPPTGDGSGRTRPWVSRGKVPALDVQNITKAMQQHIDKQCWINGMKGSTLFQGVHTFKGFKLEKNMST